MFGGQASADLVGRDGARRIRLQRIVSRTHLLVQPVFHRTVPRQQCAEPVTDDLAFAGVFARSDLSLYNINHFVRQRNAQLLRRSHGKPLFQFE
jgi:hypothetical protein